MRHYKCCKTKRALAGLRSYAPLSISIEPVGPGKNKVSEKPANLPVLCWVSRKVGFTEFLFVRGAKITLARLNV